MKRLFFLLFILLIVIGFSFIFNSERKFYRNQIRQLELKNDNLYACFTELFSIHKNEQALLFYDLNKLEIVDNKENKKRLATTPIKNKLGVYIDSNMCGLCVDKTIKNLEKYIEKIGKENIFIIGSGYRAKYFFSGTPFKDWGTLYLSSSSCFSNIETETPILFYVDSNNRICYSYIQAKNIELDLDFFIKKIIEKK